MKKTLLLMKILFVVGILNLNGQNITGLAVVVNFTDNSVNGDLADISAMLNQPSGFDLWNNNGSVNEFFSKQSNGAVDLKYHVIEINLDKSSFTYDKSQPYDGGQKLAENVVAKINEMYPQGFSGLTKYKGENRIWSFLMLTSSPYLGGVAYGIIPALSLSVINDGISLPIKHVAISNFYDSQKTIYPSISVTCHEIGHNVFGWHDYYNSEGVYDTNIGHYGLMGSGGDRYNPMPVNGALRYHENWVPTDSIIEIVDAVNATYSVKANSTSMLYKYTNPNNTHEYFLIEAFKHGDYYLSVCGDGYPLDEGLAVWYVNERYYSDPNVPRIKLVQADGIDEMHDDQLEHRDLRGDDSDLFNDNYPSLVPGDNELFRWQDGSLPNLQIINVSIQEENVSFDVVTGSLLSITSVGGNMYGDIFPAGKVYVKPGDSHTVNFSPKFGCRINDVKVNGISKGDIVSYTFPSIQSNQSVDVEFEVANIALVDPWQGIDIGYASQTGNSLEYVGTFRLETYGDDIWGTSDNFHFVYQTLIGDGEIIARVVDMEVPHSWSKSGVMIRESLDAGSKHVMMVKTQGNGIATQYRSLAGGNSNNYNNADLQSVDWIKVKREGNTFTTFYSENGTDWELFKTTYIAMSTDALIGICVCGARDSNPNISLFENVTINADSHENSCNAPQWESGVTYDTYTEIEYDGALYYNDWVTNSDWDGYPGQYNWGPWVFVENCSGSQLKSEHVTVSSTQTYGEPIVVSFSKPVANATISIIDNLGRVLLNDFVDGTDIYNVILNEFSTGAYSLRVSGDNVNFTQTIIVSE